MSSYNGYWNFSALNKAVSPDVPDSIITDTVPGFYMPTGIGAWASAPTPSFTAPSLNRGGGRSPGHSPRDHPPGRDSVTIPHFARRRDTVVGIDGAILEVYDPLAPGTLHAFGTQCARGAQFHA